MCKKPTIVIHTNHPAMGGGKKNPMESIHGIILAAGKGKRMLSDLPKVLHLLAGKPLIWHVMDAAREAGIKSLTIVVGHGREEVMSSVSQWQNHNSSVAINFASQNEQKGTGHAVLVSQASVPSIAKLIIILVGDTPLINSETLKNAISSARVEKSETLVITTILPDPKGYGRIVRDTHNKVVKIIEEKDASDAERSIHEVNTGIFILDTIPVWDFLHEVGANNAQGEYYLTDIVAITKSHGGNVACYKAEKNEQFIGVNSMEDLERVEQIFLKSVENVEKLSA